MNKENLIGGANVEEIVSALWAICAILCFGFGFVGWGVAFTTKAIIDILLPYIKV